MYFGVEKDSSVLGRRAPATVNSFSTSYYTVRGTGFSAAASVETKKKKKKQVEIENELIVAVSQLHPQFEKICSTKQSPHQRLKGGCDSG